VQDLKTICIFDPAIDIVKIPRTILEEFALTRELKKIEPFYKPGLRPTYYNIRRIPRSVMRRMVWPAASDEEKYAKCFQYGVTSVEGLYQEDGSRVGWEPTGTVTTPDGELLCLLERELNSERFSDSEILEIGAVVWYRSFLQLTIKDGYRLPHSSVATLGNLTYRAVAASLMDAAQSNEKPLGTQEPPGKVPTEPSKENTESKSETLMDAIAVAK
jgi:hypothetical protein